MKRFFNVRKKRISCYCGYKLGDHKIFVVICFVGYIIVNYLNY